jgi:hypothetical protein
MDYIFDRIPCYLPDDECWEYQGYLNPDGYGSAHLTWKSSNVLAHRTMYQEYYGDTLVPNEVVRHTCDNRACCNPHHLVKGTQADNVRDCVERGRFPNRAGESNGRACLTQELVDNIRKIYSSKMWSYGLLAQLFEVDKSTIAHILKMKTWK